MSTDTYIYINKIEINILKGKLSQDTPMLSSQKTVTHMKIRPGVVGVRFFYSHTAETILRPF